MRINRRFTIIVIFLLLMNIASPVFCISTFPLDTKKISFIKYERLYNYIEASDFYEYGRIVGERFRPFLRFLTKINCFECKSKQNNVGTPCPAYYDEILGLSDGSKIKIENILNLINGISTIFDKRCTATLSTNSATKNNETFLTKNFDYPLDGSLKSYVVLFLERLSLLKPWVVKIDTMRYKYAFWGLPGILELPIINEKGLGWASPGTNFAKNESRYVDEGPGISTIMLERLAMMTCKNVSEVADFWINAERALLVKGKFPHHWDGSTEAYCDKEGNILMIEQTHNYIITVFGDSTEITNAPEGILWHTNHHQWLDPNLTGSIYLGEDGKAAQNTFVRAEQAKKLLLENYGNITIETCKSITRDHSGGLDENKKDSYDICRHPDKFNNHVTAFAWIINPKELTVYYTRGCPCKSRFIKIDFSKIF